MEQTTGGAALDTRVLQHIRNTARRLAGAHAAPGMDAQDIEQNLILDLWRRRAAFDASRASFRTFADRVVAHRVAELTRTTARAAAEGAMLSLSLPLDDEEEGGATLADALPDPRSLADLDEQHGLSLDVRRFTQHLTPALQRCCSILLAPNVADAAAEAGLHRSSVYENLHRLRSLATAAGLHDYVRAPRHFVEPASKCGA